MKKLALYVSIIICNFLACYPVLAIEYSEGKLKNGLKYLVIEDHKVPFVNVGLWIKAGAAHEDAGKSSVANLIANYFDSGNYSLTHDVQIEIERGKLDQFTNIAHDYSLYNKTVISNKLNQLLEYEAFKFSKLNLSDNDFENAKKLQKQKVNLANELETTPKIIQKVNDKLFENTEYGVSNLGLLHDIDNISVSDIKNYHKNYYNPNNSLLVIVGDIKAKQVEQYIKNNFATKSNSPSKNSFKFKDQTVNVKDKIEITGSKENTQFYTRQYLAPKITTDSKDYYSLEVLAALLGGGESSILNRELIRNLPFAKRITTDYSPVSLGNTAFSLNANLIKGADFERFESLVTEAIERIKEGDFSDDELVSSKNYLIANNYFNLDGYLNLGLKYGAVIATGNDSKLIEQWPQEINQVSKQQIIEVATKYLTENYVVGYQFPKK